MFRNLPVTFILITVMIDAMGIGLILPVMPELIMDVRETSISDAAVWGGILSATFAVMQFLFSPTLGNLSDRLGRRPVLLTSTAVMAFDYILMALAGTIWLLLVGRIIRGITAATQSTASAFMADISPREKKAQNFGLISAGFGVGFVLGPIIGGLLAELGPRAPFYAAAILAGANFIFGYFVLPETVTPDKRRPFRWSRANPAGGLKHIGALPGLSLLLAVYFFYQISNMVYPAIWAYHTQAAFDWGPRMIGASLALYGVSMAVTQGYLIRIVIRFLGEVRTVYWGLLYNVLTLTLFGFATQGWMLLVLTPLAAFGAVVAPALQGVMSGRAADDQQGELQGVLASINAIGMIATPLIMTRVFSTFTSEDTPLDLPGAPFLLAMLLMLVSWVFYTNSLKADRRTTANAP
ncbi:TCR/Tet family MFS transporter [Litoreibacter roseus]|uniref:Tetracycline resistance MFS efflux pump n=1 Tax=Litoreibacter roseus TaxID=2601869 RepID=A0A6N6JA29_9RHOB|nr:TCR/Tet family MFS transporter [Litoreibacter roseus]GFE63045.1 tetracycline resistance MFS efflux pump [Litoreibacter roseus]